MTRITGTIREDLCLFMKISDSLHLRMRNISDKSCGENQYILCLITFIPSFHWHVQNATIPCCSQKLLPFLSVMYFFLPPFLPTILPSSLTSSCHLLLGLPLNLFVPKFIHFWEFYFLPFSVHAQTNVIYLTLLSLL